MPNCWSSTINTKRRTRKPFAWLHVAIELLAKQGLTLRGYHDDKVDFIKDGTNKGKFIATWKFFTKGTTLFSNTFCQTECLIYQQDSLKWNHTHLCLQNQRNARQTVLRKQLMLHCHNRLMHKSTCQTRDSLSVFKFCVYIFPSRSSHQGVPH